MEEFSLAEAAQWTGGRTTGQAVLAAVSTDTRTIAPGSLFIPLIGDRFDGHDYIDKAIEAGAAAVMSVRAEAQYPVPCLYVKDTRQALLDLAGGYRAQFSCPVVAVTGSVGKTTTKDMIAGVLSEEYCTLKTPKNLNNTIGMPQTILRLDHTVEAAVIEMGMNHFGEISSMTACGQPNIAVITTIGTSHIENLGSREGICQAKMEILEGLSARGGIAVLNGDEPLLWEKRQGIAARKVWFGVENPDCEVRAEAIEADAAGVTFTAVVFDARFPVRLYAPGVHNVGNALAAAACGHLLGLTPEQIAAGLEAFRPEGRQELYEAGGFRIYEDCYNASPDSMEAALAVLGTQQGRRFAVLGSMLELGGYAAEGHRRAGRAAAGAADQLYLYGFGAADMRQGALEAGMAESAVRVFETHEELAQALRQTAEKGDTLLFKGSHGMHMERVLGLFLGKEV